jgi:hypothetical protein
VFGGETRLKVCVDKGNGLQPLPAPHFTGFSKQRAEEVAEQLTENPGNDYRYEAVRE